MKKVLPALCVALASLLAAGAHAQKSGPGEDKSVTSTPTTAAEKAAAKDARKAEGTKVSKAKEGITDTPTTAGKARVATKEERMAARAKRRAAAAAAARQPKEANGPN